MNQTMRHTTSMALLASAWLLIPMAEHVKARSMVAAVIGMDQDPEPGRTIRQIEELRRAGKLDEAIAAALRPGKGATTRRRDDRGNGRRAFPCGRSAGTARRMDQSARTEHRGLVRPRACPGQGSLANGKRAVLRRRLR